MNELPKVYASRINNDIKNSQQFYYGSLRGERKIDVNKKIDIIFSSFNHVYKSNVKITTNDSILNKLIVCKTKNNLITLDGELISINSIMDIEKI